MIHPSLFDASPPDPGDSDAPQSLPDNGAHADDQLSDTKRIDRAAGSLAPVRRNAPETSHAAARRIEGVASALCQRVLAFIREHGEHGATDAETQAGLGMLTQTQTPRRNALAKVGAVVDSRQRRLTPSNRKAIVWVVPEHAPKAAGNGAGVKP